MHCKEGHWSTVGRVAGRVAGRLQERSRKAGGGFRHLVVGVFPGLELFLAIFMERRRKATGRSAGTPVGVFLTIFMERRRKATGRSAGTPVGRIGKRISGEVQNRGAR